MLLHDDTAGILKELLSSKVGSRITSSTKKDYVFIEESLLVDYRADAYVVRCTDNRFWKVFKHFIKYLEFGNIDVASPPGGAKVFSSPAKEEDREVALEKIKLLTPVHHIRRVVLFTHADCAAYGGSSRFNNDENQEFGFHCSELRKAADVVRGRFPDLAVETYFIDHKGIVKVN